MWYKINKRKKALLVLGFFAAGVGFFFIANIHHHVGWYGCFVSGGIFLVGGTLGIIAVSYIEVLLERG